MIHTEGLTRHFRAKGHTVEAVRGIDLDVGRGELVAFLGPNGAGKSTTLRMLTTLLQPTSGTARVVGCDVATDPGGVRRGIGFIGQGNSAGHNQRVRDELVSQGRSYGLDRSSAASRSDELIDALDLGELRDRVVSSLSGGQRRRLDVALGMVHRPELLFLDEPSTGLDPQNRANLSEQIERLRVDHGTTIVLTTHYLEEADALADRVVVVDHGRVIADDTPERLKAELAGDLMALTAADPRTAATLAERMAGAGGSELAVTAATVTGRMRNGTRLLPGLLRELDADGIAVAAAEVTRPTLDDVFLALTGRSLRESAATDPAQLAAAGPSTTEPDRAEPNPTTTDTATPILQEQPS